MRILITGTAGFIGNHLAMRLLDRGDEVYGIDNVNNYYDVTLKESRLARIKDNPRFTEGRFCLTDATLVKEAFNDFNPDFVVNLAAQAGVRYSIENPMAYIDSNIIGMLNILEGCREVDVKHLVFASTSSVYGTNTKMPFAESDGVDHPISLYAATKRANELMAHNYAHVFGIPATGLRFFTVYGPWGRPDMALFLFTKAISEGRPIDVFNNGKMRRSFTYVDDIVEGIVRVIEKAPAPVAPIDPDQPEPNRSGTAPFQVFNIGNNQSVELMRYIELIEEYLGRKAIMNMMPIQPGDVPVTESDVTALREAVGYEPKTTVEDGVRLFVEWFKEYYKV